MCEAFQITILLPVFEFLIEGETYLSETVWRLGRGCGLHRLDVASHGNESFNGSKVPPEDFGHVKKKAMTAPVT